jgi:hypothetical protein
MAILIKYTVPVYVEVNLDEGTIERVVVQDDEATLAEADPLTPGIPVVFDADTWEEVTDAERDAAVALAQGSDDADWPAWCFGW